jgi:mono/diheme cytochrome c family protein
LVQDLKEIAVIFNALSVLILLLLAGLFARLTVAAWRSRRGFIRWPGLVLAGLLSVVFIAVTILSVLGFYRLNNAPYRYSVSDVKVAMTPEQIARGEQLAFVCADCHSSTGSFPLDGSKDNFIAGGPPVGVIYASNLTPGGPLKDWSDGEIIRALREGVNNRGVPLVIMPSKAFHHFSDDDAQAIVAFLRSQPAVNRELPERNLNALAAVFFGTGIFPTAAQPPIMQPVIAPAPGSAAYGEYLTSALACADCHGEKLDGVLTGPGPSGGPNLSVIVPLWTEEQFITFFQAGMLPEGRQVDPQRMPWKAYGQVFSVEDLKDIYHYIVDLP